MKTACALCMTRMFWSYDKTSKSSILAASQFWPAAFYWSHLRRYLKINIFTSRKRGGEGNVFSRVCVSGERGGALYGGVPYRTGFWPYPPVQGPSHSPMGMFKLVHVGPYYTGTLAQCSNLFGLDLNVQGPSPRHVQSCSLCCAVRKQDSWHSTEMPSCL